MIFPYIYIYIIFIDLCANNQINYCVDVHSVDLFKTRLDEFWKCQDVVFDWKADLSGTGDRSESSVLRVL